MSVYRSKVFLELLSIFLRFGQTVSLPCGSPIDKKRLPSDRYKCWLQCVSGQSTWQCRADEGQVHNRINPSFRKVLTPISLANTTSHCTKVASRLHLTDFALLLPTQGHTCLTHPQSLLDFILSSRKQECQTFPWIQSVLYVCGGT